MLPRLQSLPFFFHPPGTLQPLPSFPTRRSSDLAKQRQRRLRINVLSVVLVFGLCLFVGIGHHQDRKSTRLNSSHVAISYAVFCLKKKIDEITEQLLDNRLHMSYCNTHSSGYMLR